MNKLVEYIHEYDPVLHVPIYLMLFHTTWTYVVGELTGNCSQVDRVSCISDILSRNEF